jgi:hypothetical protein
MRASGFEPGAGLAGLGPLLAGFWARLFQLAAAAALAITKRLRSIFFTQGKDRGLNVVWQIIG